MTDFATTIATMVVRNAGLRESLRHAEHDLARVRHILRSLEHACNTHPLSSDVRALIAQAVDDADARVMAHGTTR